MSSPPGVLLGQLGTPDAPTPQMVRRYLRQFLSDPLVVPLNPLLWRTALNLFILPRYAPRSAERYRRIWTAQGSPLQVITQRQAAALAAELKDTARVAFGMRYGAPSLIAGFEELVERGCRRVLLLPMFPQYSRSTNLSMERLLEDCRKHRHPRIELRSVRPFFNHPAYLEALGGLINRALGQLSAPAQRLMLSYHGLPEKTVAAGDPYCRMCEETTALLRPRLKLEPAAVLHTYQSRFGRGRWVGPHTDEELARLADQGIGDVVIACPGFTADCLETLDELGFEARASFLARGGRRFSLVPCLNDDPAWIRGLGQIVREELGGLALPGHAGAADPHKLASSAPK